MRPVRWLALVLVVLPAILLAAGGGAPPKPDLVPEIRPRPSRTPVAPVVEEPPRAAAARPRFTAAAIPDDAMRLAAADLLTLTPAVRPLVRYLWLRHGTAEEARLASLALAYLTRGKVIIRPAIVAGGLLARVYLPAYAPSATDLVDWIKTWEELQFDPDFSLLITRDVARLLRLADDQLPMVKVKKQVVRRVPAQQQWRTEERDITVDRVPYTAPDDERRVYRQVIVGRSYSFDLKFKVGSAPADVIETVEELVSIGAAGKFDVVRVNSSAIDPVVFSGVQQAAASQAPVVALDYFVIRALATIQGVFDAKDDDNRVFTVVYGGLYYRFRGIRKAKDVLGADTKASDEDLFFQDQVGLGNIKGGLTAAQLFDRLGSDQRTAIFKSGVTGKKRRVDLFNTPQQRTGSGWGAITHDIRDEDVDLGGDPIANLFNSDDFAREAIFPGPTGVPVFTLFNKRGELQNEVPFNVALDTTIPRPHSQRLQVMGCIGCHAAEDGWRTVGNDVRQLLGRYGKAGLIGDLSLIDQTIPETLDRAAGLFAGDFKKQLLRARDDQAEALLLATGPWPDDQDQTGAARIGAIKLKALHDGRKFGAVDATRALRDLGVSAADQDWARAGLDFLLPADRRARVGDIIPEDPRLAGLLAGISIGATDWDFARAFAAERSRGRRVSLLAGDYTVARDKDNRLLLQGKK